MDLPPPGGNTGSRTRGAEISPGTYRNAEEKQDAQDRPDSPSDLARERVVIRNKGNKGKERMQSGALTNESPADDSLRRPRKAYTTGSTRSFLSDMAPPPPPSASAHSEQTGDEIDYMTDRGADYDSEPESRMYFEGGEDDVDDRLEVDWVNPEPQRRLPENSSSKKRVPLGGSIHAQAKKLVLVTDPNRGQCILTGEEPGSSIQWAHMLRRATKEPELTTIEWHFGMKWESLYIDTRFNLVGLQADLHLALDNGQWALVPHFGTIRVIANWVRDKGRKKGSISKYLETQIARGEFSTKHSRPSGASAKASRPSAASGSASEPATINIYSYYMLPLNDAIKTKPIHRRPDITQLFDVNVDEIRHTFPFTTVGRLKSHIQPHFVIYAVGAKLHAIETSMEKNGEDFNAWLGTLSLNASFGHHPYRNQREAKVEKEDQVDIRNLESLDNIRYIYREWTKDTDVPKKGSEDPWRVYTP
ncbi:hypothetical protein B0H17DRAFT_1128665 [Mycena rosella]|uniref:HNH nuclease domain-containing protein n=1 Tax=Mycena rosella TaxID=1033263 RepID=A0AAD7GPB7_MYCRO|nr:hypothetical protein B0H17DRAFT_1128665 [Mycena rosella]